MTSWLRDSFSWLVVGLLAFPPSVFAGQAHVEVGSIAVLKGTADIFSITGTKTPAKVGALVFQGDSIATAARSAVQVKLKDDSMLTVAPSSKLVMSQFDQKGQPPMVALAYGQLRAAVTKSKDKSVKMLIKTPTAAMGIRGTELEAVFNPETQATSTLTYEGVVAVTKADPPAQPLLSAEQAGSLQTVGNLAAAANPVGLSAIQLNALAQAEGAVEKAAQAGNKSLTPAQKEAMQAVQQMAAGNKNMQLSPEQAKAVVEVQKMAQEMIPPPPAPTASVDQIQSMAKIGDALASKAENLSPAQEKALAQVQALAANAPAGGAQVAMTPEQVKAVEAVQAMAQEKLASPPPTTLSQEQAQGLLTVQKLTEQNAVPEIMSEGQKQAMAQVKWIAMDAAKAGKPLELTPEQVQSIKAVEMLAKTSLDPASLPPAMVKEMQKAEQTVNGAIAPKAAALSPELSKAVDQMKAAVQTASQLPAGISPAQAQALQQLNQAAAYVAPAAQTPSMNADQAKAIQQVQEVALKNVDKSALSPEQAKAFEAVSAMAAKASAGGAPMALSAEQMKAIAQVQQVAVASSSVAATISPPQAIMANLNNPAKVVEVTQGQYSGMAAGQAAPTVPVKISPAQLEIMKANSPMQAAGRDAKSDAGGMAPAKAGAILSPVPPGLDAKLISAGGAETKKMMEQTAGGMGGPDSLAAGGPGKGGPGNAPPPEGFFDKASGKMAPPAGGFVDLKTGVYMPPPPGSAFDPVAGVYVPPAAMGSFQAATGQFLPPAGMALDATRGFVPEKLAGGPNKPEGAPPPRDMFAMAAGVPPPEMLGGNKPAEMPPMAGVPGGDMRFPAGAGMPQPGALGAPAPGAGPGLPSGPGGMGMPPPPGGSAFMDPSKFGDMNANVPPPGFAPGAMPGTVDVKPVQGGANGAGGPMTGPGGPMSGPGGGMGDIFLPGGAATAGPNGGSYLPPPPNGPTNDYSLCQQNPNQCCGFCQQGQQSPGTSAGQSANTSHIVLQFN